MARGQERRSVAVQRFRWLGSGRARWDDERTLHPLRVSQRYPFQPMGDLSLKTIPVPARRANATPTQPAKYFFRLNSVAFLTPTPTSQCPEGITCQIVLVPTQSVSRPFRDYTIFTPLAVVVLDSQTPAKTYDRESARPCIGSGVWRQIHLAFSDVRCSVIKYAPVGPKQWPGAYSLDCRLHVI